MAVAVRPMMMKNDEMMMTKTVTEQWLRIPIL